MKKLGAPRKISDETILEVIKLINSGLNQSEACRRVGVKINTFTEMKSRYKRPELFMRLKWHILWLKNGLGLR